MEKSNFLADLSLGWHEFTSRAWLWSIVLQFAIVNAVYQGSQSVLGPAVAKGHYDGAAGWGLIGAAQAVGLVCGGLMFLRARPQRMLLVATLGLLLVVPYLFGLAIPLPLVSVLVLAFAAGLGIETFGVLWDTTMQQEIPQDRLSRVYSYDALGSFALIPLGLALAGPLAEAIGTRATLIGGRPALPGGDARWCSSSPRCATSVAASRSSCASRCSKASPDARRGARRARGVPRPLRRRAARAGRRSKEIGGALCLRLEPLSTVTMFNRVLGLGIEQPASDEQLDEALGFLRGVQAYVTVAPEAAPADLGDRLAARGLAPDRGWTKFSRSTADPPQASTELRVERDEPRRRLRRGRRRAASSVPDLFLDWLRRLPGRDGWQCFVAFDGDAPAAAGALYVTGEVGWIGIGATIPEQRGKGGQSALLAARIQAAADAGCEVVVTETGEPVDGQPNGSYRNIVRAGFEPQYVRPNYLSATAAS